MSLNGNFLFLLAGFLKKGSSINQELKRNQPKEKENFHSSSFQLTSINKRDVSLKSIFINLLLPFIMTLSQL